MANLRQRAGYLAAIHPITSRLQRLPATHILNPHYPLVNQNLLLRHADRSDNIHFCIQYYAVFPASDTLRNLFQLDRSNNIWLFYNPIPPILYGLDQRVFCPTTHGDDTFILGYKHPVPTFKYLASFFPNIRIRQHARIQLLYSHNRGITYTAPLIVRGSRGFSHDYNYEILELQCPEVDTNNKNYTMFLFVPPPFVHIEVGMITSSGSSNEKTHADLLERWNAVEKQQVKKLTELGKLERSLTVWKLLQDYLEARREQAP